MKVSLNTAQPILPVRSVILEMLIYTEYDDDTSVIPRSTTVIAKRLPAVKVGRGGAARYVSGKMPQYAKAYHQMETPTTKPSSSNAPSVAIAMNGAQNEEEKIAAMFKLGADQWVQQQQEMAK